MYLFGGDFQTFVGTTAWTCYWFYQHIGAKKNVPDPIFTVPDLNTHFFDTVQ